MSTTTLSPIKNSPIVAQTIPVPNLDLAEVDTFLGLVERGCVDREEGVLGAFVLIFPFLEHVDSAHVTEVSVLRTRVPGVVSRDLFFVGRLNEGEVLGRLRAQARNPKLAAKAAVTLRGNKSSLRGDRDLDVILDGSGKVSVCSLIKTSIVVLTRICNFHLLVSSRRRLASPCRFC